MKVKFFNKRVFKKFLEYTSVIATILSLFVIFKDIPPEMKQNLGYGFVILLCLLYFYVWGEANYMEEVHLNIDGSEVIVKSGDIFDQSGFKVIAFNEYFDTQVDDRIISRQSLNGIFINKFFSESTQSLDEHIANYKFDNDVVIEENTVRNVGKKTKYNIGTICLYDEYILTAFSKFDEHNRAYLTMPEYLEFLIKFWDNVNRVYSQKSVSVPVFGSGITRIKEQKNISDEELLKIMLWTFRISEMNFKYPAKLTIVIHQDKIDRINLFNIETAKNGL